MKKILPILLILLLCLTGCSSSADPNAPIVIGWENGTMSYKGKTFTVDSYKGYTAMVSTGMGGLSYNIFLDTANDVTSISCNTQSILEENMDKYKGCFYYTEYLRTQFTMAKNIGETSWAVVQCPMNGLDKTVVATYAEKYISDIPLTNGVVNVDFGSFKFGTEYDTVEVRTDCALIPGLIKVSQGTYDCSTPVTIVQGKKEYQLMKGSSSNYDYYMYDGYLIQSVAGLDIATYITFD